MSPTKNSANQRKAIAYIRVSSQRQGPRLGCKSSPWLSKGSRIVKTWGQWFVTRENDVQY